MKRLQQVLLIHPEGNLFDNPTLNCFIALMLENDVEVWVRRSRSSAPMPPISGVHYLCYGRATRKLKAWINYKIGSAFLSYGYVLLEHMLIYKRKFDLIFGVDASGLIDAGALARITDTPYVFVSFEIVAEAESSSKRKRLERMYSEHVAMWIVQDEDRASLLAQENRLNVGTRMLLPLASSGSGKLEPVRLRDRLGIPPEKRVAILLGTLGDWSMTKEILDTLPQWPEEWVLVIHGRYGNTMQELRRLGHDQNGVPKGRLFISSEAPLSVDQMGSVLAGVDAAIAFYRPTYRSPTTGLNLKVLGLSSGKISTCLRYGVPVLMNEIGLYSELAKTHRFAILIDQMADISRALQAILDPVYKKNALAYFLEHLDFSQYKASLWDRLSALHANGHPKRLASGQCRF